ncbi:CRISPR-associated protein Cas2 [Porphyromonas gulae]|uniref:CRISPR-associated endonuclease Cas2 n=1 Tax=Porphyromonas gulae TaxID=111105 RepID=UPI00052DEB25|nr:CRISPR-associated endonuclease Cas2 [Porphyromonas gulae]KGN70962.1 CRISPR-associated protein Cas2 [Porphyromonas gulae]
MNDKKLLVAYDISSNRRRCRVARILEQCGVRINKSVFIYSLRELTMDKLVEAVTSQTAKRDKVFFLPLCHHCYAAAWMSGHPTPPKSRRKRKSIVV